jgi:hypothetical protein
LFSLDKYFHIQMYIEISAKMSSIWISITLFAFVNSKLAVTLYNIYMYMCIASSMQYSSENYYQYICLMNKSWWPTTPQTSTKQTITSHLKPLNTKKYHDISKPNSLFSIQDRHRNVVGLNQLIEFQPFPIW